MIELSVVMPMFRAKYIGWLALESLVRQKNINFEWELIIAEELYDETMGENEVSLYKDKLCDLGCVKFEYIGLEKWIPLSKKIHLLAQKCDPESKIFMGQAADYFSPPLRLFTHYKIYNENEVHFVVPTKAIYYNIANEKVVLQDVEMPKYNKLRVNDVIGKSWDLSLVRQIPAMTQKKGLDGWLWNQAHKIVGEGNLITIYDQTDNWKYGMATHGLNNLAFMRELRMSRFEPPFIKCPIDINETIPKVILDRLKECKKFIKKHKKGLPKIKRR